MTVFGDIIDVKNISINSNETLTVPDGEIWKVTADLNIIDFWENSRNRKIYLYLKYDSSRVLGVYTDGRDENYEYFVQQMRDHTEIVAEEGKKFSFEVDEINTNEVMTATVNFNIIVMEAPE